MRRIAIILLAVTVFWLGQGFAQETKRETILYVGRAFEPPRLDEYQAPAPESLEEFFLRLEDCLKSLPQEKSAGLINQLKIYKDKLSAGNSNEEKLKVEYQQKLETAKNELNEKVESALQEQKKFSLIRQEELSAKLEKQWKDLMVTRGQPLTLEARAQLQEETSRGQYRQESRNLNQKVLEEKAALQKAFYQDSRLIGVSPKAGSFINNFEVYLADGKTSSLEFPCKLKKIVWANASADLSKLLYFSAQDKRLVLRPLKDKRGRTLLVKTSLKVYGIEGDVWNVNLINISGDKAIPRQLPDKFLVMPYPEPKDWPQPAKLMQAFQENADTQDEGKKLAWWMHEPGQDWLIYQGGAWVYHAYPQELLKPKEEKDEKYYSYHAEPVSNSNLSSEDLGQGAKSGQLAK